jgi:protein TonB
MRRTALLRLALFLAVAAFHGLLLLFFAVYLEPAINEPEPPLRVMKLTDIREEIPLPPKPPPEPPPPPAAEPALPPAASQTRVEAPANAMAETMTVAEEAPEPAAPPAGALTAPAAGPRGEEEAYLPMNRVSKPPKFSERAIRDALEYPPLARRSGIEGAVILELFIDKAGEIQRIDILREHPSGRGFGEAAKKAFQGLRAVPAEANGVTVGVRYRYPVRFTMR